MRDLKNYDQATIPQATYDSMMNQLNLRYFICIISRFVMYICLLILFINIFKNIEQFSHEQNKKVNVDVLVGDNDN